MSWTWHWQVYFVKEFRASLFLLVLTLGPQLRGMVQDFLLWIFSSHESLVELQSGRAIDISLGTEINCNDYAWLIHWLQNICVKALLSAMAGYLSLLVSRFYVKERFLHPYKECFIPTWVLTISHPWMLRFFSSNQWDLTIWVSGGRELEM